MTSRFVSLACVGLLLAVRAAAGPADVWITKARSFLGTEQALDAVQSVHFTGKLELTEMVPSAADPTVRTPRLVTLPVDIVFQRPDRQRIQVRAEAVEDTTALDGYDGWNLRVNPKNPQQRQLSLLDAGRIKQLRANTWENLHFFRGIEKQGGKVEVRGEEVVDGVACVKLDFAHTPQVSFLRYFDKATGRLVKTVTQEGVEIREEGEQIVGGIRFPKRVGQKAPNGQVTTVVVDRVSLNETFPAAHFAVPGLR